MWLIVGVTVALALVGCSLSVGATQAPSAQPSPTAGASGSAVRYVALGDSYTIGTSVSESERWPNQLAGRLAGTVPLQLVANLGVNGFSSADLIDVELPRLDNLQPDFLTVLIGVNDVVRGVTRDTYQANLESILADLLKRVPTTRIIVVSTPDYTLTPAGADFGDPQQQSSAIGDFNAIERDSATARGIAFVDISPVANRVPGDRALVADDGLHPSGKQYAGWVDLIAPVVAEQLLAP